MPAFGIDLIPRNFVVGAQGSLSLFDAEWRFTSIITHHLILVRGIAYAVAACPYAPGLSGKKVKDVVISIVAGLGYEISEEDLVNAVRIEDEFQGFVHDTSMSPFQQVLDHIFPVQEPSSLLTLIHQAEETTQLRKEIQRIKATASWQLTKPLRFWSYLFKKFRND
jgi:hypothetical protein